jgi:hypothetical protein
MICEEVHSSFAFNFNMWRYDVASTMATIMCHNPAVAVTDLSSLRIMSCGGCPLAPTAVKRALAIFGCEFFISYGRGRVPIFCSIFSYRLYAVLGTGLPVHLKPVSALCLNVQCVAIYHCCHTR